MGCIVIVDDELHMRLLMQGMLRQDGHDVLLADSATEAMRLVQENTVDLLITDLVMPQTTGIDLIVQIKEAFPNIKVIAVSGGGGITGRFDYLPIAKLVGAGCILSKPFKKEQLCTAVAAALK